MTVVILTSPNIWAALFSMKHLLIPGLFDRSYLLYIFFLFIIFLFFIRESDCLGFHKHFINTCNFQPKVRDKVDVISSCHCFLSSWYQSAKGQNRIKTMNKHHDWLFWTFSFWGSLLKKITSDDRIMVAISQTLALEVNWNFFKSFGLLLKFKSDIV